MKTDSDVNLVGTVCHICLRGRRRKEGESELGSLSCIGDGNLYHFLNVSIFFQWK